MMRSSPKMDDYEGSVSQKATSRWIIVGRTDELKSRSDELDGVCNDVRIFTRATARTGDKKKTFECLAQKPQSICLNQPTQQITEGTTTKFRSKAQEPGHDSVARQRVLPSNAPNALRSLPPKTKPRTPPKHTCIPVCCCCCCCCCPLT